MTYGDTTSDLRQVVTELLRRHRILQPLGGPGIHTAPVTTTVEERREMGQEIQRFRHASLLWCHQAAFASTPKFTLVDKTARSRGPAEEFRYRLGETLGAITVDLPRVEDLATPHSNTLVETWRLAARASALGEHDFPAGVDYTRLDAKQSLAVLKDAADFVRGLVVLDRRYKNVPGWESFKNPGRLGQAAEVCSVFAAWEERDYSVDSRGWRPPAAAIQGPALPGIAGVVQAQHNMLVDLARFPTALNLRRIFQSQAEVAHEAARHAALAAPEVVERFIEREQTYKLLQKDSRNLGGLVGHGGVAAVESRNAEGRLKHTPVGDDADAPALRELARLFTATDARIASTLEYGFQQNLYFVSIKYPRLGDQAVNGVIQQRERWVPVTSPVQTELLPIVRGRLRPIPHPRAAEPKAVESRRSYEVLLAAQPGARRAGPPR